ncbi:unnamed protein product [Brassica oleracea var. botrytis]
MYKYERVESMMILRTTVRLFSLSSVERVSKMSSSDEEDSVIHGFIFSHHQPLKIHAAEV